VDRVNCVAVGRAEGQVQFPAIGTGGWTEPEAGDAIVPDRPTTKAPPRGD